MEVILVADLDKFGKRGSVIKVKDGFARNFLIPRNLAVPATAMNLKRVQEETKRVEGLRQQEKQKAQALCERLGQMSITLPVTVHDEEELYGSITAVDIAEALKQEGNAEVSKEAVVLDEPIKSLGVYEVEIRLHPEVSAKVKVWVVKK